MAADSFDKNGAACLEEKSTKAEADTVVLRIAIQEEKDDLPDWTHVIRFNDLNANREGVMADENLTQASLGQRHVHELHLERYISQASSATSDDIPLKELPDNIPYFSGIPSVEVTEGIIHLFRDKSKKLDDRISSILCVLGVPAHMSLSDFLNFISPSLSSIESIQVVRDSVPNQYMILLRFKDKAAARLFYSLYNMKRYNSLEKRVCQLVYASRIEVLKTSQCVAIPNEGLVELPSCPVCLDRLDESILTILCNHSFHTECLTKWEDSTCPVCRYTQIPEPTSDNTCMTCDSKEDLWICLICGNVGCGRYHGGHAHDHFMKTQHTFSMQLGTQRVWDYIGDNYVHRLVQNKTDGKLVEVSGVNTELSDFEKIDSLQLEYTYLLTSQLESQRLYFEEKVMRVEEEFRDQVSRLEMRCRLSASEKEELEDKIEEQEKERKDREKKINQLHGRLTKVLTELQEEKELNKCLTGNQKLYKDKIDSIEAVMNESLKKKDQEIQELKDQVKDLMFSLEIQGKISQASSETRQEIQDGQVVITSPPGDTTPKKGGRRKGKH